MRKRDPWLVVEGIGLRCIVEDAIEAPALTRPDALDKVAMERMPALPPERMPAPPPDGSSHSACSRPSVQPMCPYCFSVFVSL